MEFFNRKSCRKLESELTHEYQQQLRRLREIARRERQQCVEEFNIPSSIVNDSVSSIPPDFNHINSALSESPQGTLFLENAPQRHPEFDYDSDMETLSALESDRDTGANGSHMSLNLSIENVSNESDHSNLPRAQNEAPEDEEECDSFRRHLAIAFVESSMNHQQISAVLHALRRHTCFRTFPIDPRTILQTPRTSYPIANIAGGEYLHLGIAQALLNILLHYSSEIIPDHLLIDFSTDGATLDAQGKIQMWPIQIRLVNVPNCKPEIVGIWRGSSKPTNVTAFFQPFIDEFLLILGNGGILYNNQLHSVGIRCFVADAPARAFALAHLGHKATYPCSRCWVKGVSPRQGVTYYPYPEEMRLRTDEEYANHIDGEHHMDIDSPLLALPMSLVKTPFEYMHCTCLGCMKKLLSVIISGKYAPYFKLNNFHVQILNSRLAAIKEHCPCDFARKPENIEKYSSFKATELRQILAYTGPALFHGIVDDRVYLHFLMFHAAMRILLDSSSSTTDIDCAEQLLHIFVRNAGDVYGNEFLSYNIHCLLHLADDVKEFGPLDDFSAFPYENNMTYFREACRKPHQHLQQIVKRRAERNCVSSDHHSNEISTLIPGQPWKGILPTSVNSDCRQYKSIKCERFSISLNGKDDTLMLQDSTICIVQNIIENDNDYFFLIKTFQRVESCFDVGIPSSAVGMYRCSVLIDDLKLVNVSEFYRKCFRMPYWYDKFAEPIPDVFTVALLLHK